MAENDMSGSVTEGVPEKTTEIEGCKVRHSSSTSITTPSKSKPDTAEQIENTSNNVWTRTKALCFLLCCGWLCRCLCKREPRGGNGSNRSGDGKPPPSLSEVRSWGSSFDKLMTSEAGRKVFREFLLCEYSEENIRFWLACEDFKQLTDQEKIEEKAREIYEDYISILSPSEVSLDSRVREIINRNMMEPSSHTFDEAQLQIYTLMHRDSYPRFVNSKMYKKLANLDTTETEPAPGAGESGGPKEPHG